MILLIKLTNKMSNVNTMNTTLEIYNNDEAQNKCFIQTLELVIIPLYRLWINIIFYWTSNYFYEQLIEALNTFHIRQKNDPDPKEHRTNLGGKRMPCHSFENNVHHSNGSACTYFDHFFWTLLWEDGKVWRVRMPKLEQIWRIETEFTNMLFVACCEPFNRTETSKVMILQIFFVFFVFIFITKIDWEFATSIRYDHPDYPITETRIFSLSRQSERKKNVLILFDINYTWKWLQSNR